MSRFLLVVPPLTGHITPLAAVARRLTTSGHGVIWCGDPAMIWSIAGRDAVVRSCPPGRLQPDGSGRNLRGYAAVRFLWEDILVPLADATVDSVTETALRYRADVIVSDMQALAGPLAAARLNLPWATSATTSGPLRDSFTATPKVREWLDGLLSGLIYRQARDARRGLTPGELELSPHLVIAFTTEALVGPGDSRPQIRYVGPALTGRPESGRPFPWRQIDGRPLVVATLGTVNAHVTSGFLQACARAFDLLGGRVQAVIADPLGVLGPSRPPDVITHPYLPMLDLVARASVVICHGGHNTVCEALAQGVPLIVAPIRDDQPVIAAQVSTVGAGLRLRFGRATPEIIRDAVVAALDNPSYRSAAKTVSASFTSAGAAVAAADHLVSLARKNPARSS